MTTEPMPSHAAQTAALPVQLVLTGRHADAIRRWVEGVLGWQPVDAATASVLPPRLVLCDGAVPPDDPAASVPRVLVVDDAEVGGTTADLVLAVAPAAVVAWPSGRDRLAGCAAQALARAGAGPEARPTLRIGGSAGGVGSTTVVLAVAGLWAWDGAPTLALVRGTWPPARTIAADALAATDLWTSATPLAGIPDARCLRVDRGVDAAAIRSPAITRIVVDAGVDVDVDVLVCRPDGAGAVGVDGTTAGLILVVGDGPIPLAQLRRLAVGRPVRHLPASARVARAGALARIPAGVPGAWLRRLSPLRSALQPRAPDLLPVG